MKFFSSSDNKLHYDIDQLKRQKSALDLKLDTVDSLRQIGTIKNYNVSLSSCTCTDFLRRQKPCKHIYCLAMNLGIFKPDKEKLNNLPDTQQISKKSFMYPVHYVYSQYEPAPKDFVVIDFETANNACDSICQLGISNVKNNSIVGKKTWLIRPPYDVFTNTHIHGITFDDVKNAPTFNNLWAEIKRYIEGNTIAAYNLFFDWGCLWATLDRYQIPHPECTAFDILANARNNLTMPSYSLVNVAKDLKIEHNPHNALSDAMASAQIQIKLNAHVPNLLAMIYFSQTSTIFDRVTKGTLSIAEINTYGKNLVNQCESLDYEEHKSLFKMIEQIAAINSNADLYKLCGEFYERCEKLPRAIADYQKAISINPKLRLRAKIQRLMQQ